MQSIDVAVLGAPAVGKSSVIQQYLDCTFPIRHSPTTSALTYTPAVLANTRLYQLNIIDTPPLQYFQMKSFYDWVDFQSYSDEVKDAAAFILIFDIFNSGSFEYIKDIREQILDYRASSANELPMLVAGNKCDLGKCNSQSRRDMAHTVKKNWKSVYVECSAKYNWHVVSVFTDILKVICESRDKTSTARMRNGLKHSSCTIT